MTKEEFRTVLKGAVAGIHDDLETILRLYEPLITKYSYINGKLDEDLKQYISLHIALNISKFTL